MANIPFPNEEISLGKSAPWIRDLQNALNVAETGVFDFLTMAATVVHKFKHGLNHENPVVDSTTWNSIMQAAHGQTPEQAANERAAAGGTDNAEPAAADNQEAAARREATGGTDRSPAPDRAAAAPETGVATVGQINRTGGDVDQTQNYAATTTGTTSATDENIPPIANPATNPDAPRPDQPTVTAADQAREGGVAGGYTAAPTDTTANAPTAPAQAAGVESSQQEDNGQGKSPSPTA